MSQHARLLVVIGTFTWLHGIAASLCSRAGESAFGIFFMVVAIVGLVGMLGLLVEWSSAPALPRDNEVRLQHEIDKLNTTILHLESKLEKARAPRERPS